MKIATIGDAEDRFRLYDVQGHEISADVDVVGVENDVVTVEFEIGEKDWEEAVLVVVVERGAVMAADDFKVGTETPTHL